MITARTSLPTSFGIKHYMKLYKEELYKSYYNPIRNTLELLEKQSKHMYNEITIQDFYLFYIYITVKPKL